MRIYFNVKADKSRAYWTKCVTSRHVSEFKK